MSSNASEPWGRGTAGRAGSRSETLREAARRESGRRGSARRAAVQRDAGDTGARGREQYPDDTGSWRVPGAERRAAPPPEPPPARSSGVIRRVGWDDPPPGPGWDERGASGSRAPFGPPPELAPGGAPASGAMPRVGWSVPGAEPLAPWQAFDPAPPPAPRLPAPRSPEGPPSGALPRVEGAPSGAIPRVGPAGGVEGPAPGVPPRLAGPPSGSLPRVDANPSSGALPRLPRRVGDAGGRPGTEAGQGWEQPSGPAVRAPRRVGDVPASGAGSDRDPSGALPRMPRRVGDGPVRDGGPSSALPRVPGAGAVGGGADHPGRKGARPATGPVPRVPRRGGAAGGEEPAPGPPTTGVPRGDGSPRARRVGDGPSATTGRHDDGPRSGAFSVVARRGERPASGEMPGAGRREKPARGKGEASLPDTPRRKEPGAARGKGARVRREDTPSGGMHRVKGRRRGEGPPPPGTLRDAIRRERPPGEAPLWPGMLTPGPSSAPPERPRRPRRQVLVGLVAVAGSLATAAVVLTYTAAATNPRHSVAAVTDPILGGGPGCEPTRGDGIVRGNGLGSTDNGPEAILAFQHAYYVTRSGAAVRAVTAPDASVSPVEVIDQGIASVPPNTQHCVLISQMADGRFDVVITEVRPDASVRTYRQFVTVTVQDGRVLVAGVARPT